MFVLAIGVALTTPLMASKPVFWQTATLNDFLRGEVENLSVDGHGRLVLGPATELVAETTSPFLWGMAAAKDGTLYLGSGNEGKVFKIDPAGKTTVFFDATELEVHAVVLAPDGALFAATSPDGRIYKIDPSGKGSPFFDPDDKYIWSLVLDQQGNVYAGTGEKGLVYKVTPDGKGSIFYSTKATHVISLAFDRAGQLLAGTEAPGRLFRIDSTGKAFLVLDSTFQEIRAIRLDASGNIYLAALSGRTTGGNQPSTPPPPSEPAPAGREPIPTVTTEVTAIAVIDGGANPGGANDAVTTRDERRGGRGAIYRVRPDGLWDILWESADDSPYDLTFDTAGTLVVGTGRNGKLFSLNGEPATATLLMQASAQQVTGFARDARGTVYYATSNPGKVFKLSPQRASEGTYTSPVRDAQTVADWGTLSWRANVTNGAKVEVFTRSGNTATPDDTWSAWSGPYAVAQGEEIKSPNARYLQWKAVLTGKQSSPVLTSVSAAYVQRNLRPKVTSLTVHPAGTVFQKPYPTGDPDIAGFDDQAPDRRILSATAAPSPSSSSLGRRAYQRGLQTFVWDTTSVPNGTYVVKLVASDEPSNTPGAALDGELESSAFDIDNGPPAVSVTSSRAANGRTVIEFEVRDEWSSISKVEYSLDAQRWQPIYPRDGIFDSRHEQFELTLTGVDGAKGLIVRAYDAKNNSATARGDVVTPK
jgi:sugar lactone lactonase YvrE